MRIAFHPSLIRANKRMETGDRRRAVSDAVDRVRDRYGDEAIMPGAMLGSDGEAPDRIGFRKTDGVTIGI